MRTTNEDAIDALIDDLKETPHGVGLALLRERLLHLSQLTKASIEQDREVWENPIFPPDMYLDLCRRIDQFLAFDKNYENESEST